MKNMVSPYPHGYNEQQTHSNEDGETDTSSYRMKIDNGRNRRNISKLVVVLLFLSVFSMYHIFIDQRILNNVEMNNLYSPYNETARGIQTDTEPKSDDEGAGAKNVF